MTTESPTQGRDGATGRFERSALSAEQRRARRNTLRRERRALARRIENMRTTSNARPSSNDETIASDGAHDDSADVTSTSTMRGDVEPVRALRVWRYCGFGVWIPLQPGEPYDLADPTFTLTAPAELTRADVLNRYF